MIPDDHEAAVQRELLTLSLANNDYNNYLFGEEPAPAPSMSNPGIIATTITKKFLSACRTLETGEIVKDGYFTLFEAVGALEIGDPKMDSGCLAPGETLEETYNVNRPLSAPEVLGIIDQLLCLEMAWHLGYPLSQTILTSVYIEALVEPASATLQEADFVRNRKTPRDPMTTVLRAYCLGLVRTCADVLETIRDELYYEEEDFVTNTYRRNLMDHFDRYEIRDEILSAKHTLHGLRAKIGTDMTQALSFRLELRSAFLRALELIEDRGSPDSLQIPWYQMHSVWEAILKLPGLAKEVPEAFSTKLQRKLASSMPPRPMVTLSFDEAAKHFKKLCNDAIDAVKILDYHDSQSLLNFVFLFQAQKPQPLVYIRCLLQNLLFKDMVLLDRLSIRQVMDDDLSIVVMPAHELLDPNNDLVEAAPHSARFAMAHQMELFRKRAAQAYIDIFRVLCQNRCRVRRMLCHLIQDWEQVQLDAEDIDQLLQVQMDEKPLAYQSQTTLTLGSEPGYSLPLSSWAYLYKLRLMEWIVQLGFELEVYAPDELAGMYWYLSHLAKTRAQHVERIQAFTNHRFNELRSSSSTSHPKPIPATPWISPTQPYHPPRGWPVSISSPIAPVTTTSAAAASSSAGAGNNTSAPSAPSSTSVVTHHYSTTPEASFTRSLTYLRSTILDAAITWEFADAVSVIYTLLSRLSLITHPPRPYGTDEQRYEVRMKPFSMVSLPEVPSYQTWKGHTQGIGVGGQVQVQVQGQGDGHGDSERQQETAKQLWEFATQAVGQAKKAFVVLEGLGEREAFAGGGGGLHTFDHSATPSAAAAAPAAATPSAAAPRTAPTEAGGHGTSSSKQAQEQAHDPATGRGNHKRWMENVGRYKRSVEKAERILEQGIKKAVEMDAEGKTTEEIKKVVKVKVPRSEEVWDRGEHWWWIVPDVDLLEGVF
ncbi:Mak10 subunit, NatC N-terminal acetyltransferase-domain-containing protein [Pseudoneurospora amorphoporcata]|uniref:Mak10 subunit, NatC N-terminal acetyltransferase-domain-containing protein n=1 Tax=Pseudoneurospora amorphoporcata TaxID=241081 RepID=A0AAN6SBF9_9PEZI|nr:Mak10 subunit, NatC N-terminal acetyltransferase-domain-containing protein [Pseudoneurospora amorphoporcata]